MQFIRPIDAAGNVTSLREHFYVGFNAVHSFETDLNLEIRRLFLLFGTRKRGHTGFIDMPSLYSVNRLV